MDAYTEAHVFVAAVRVCAHSKGTHPKLEDVCQLLDMTLEGGHVICRKLKKLGIIETIEDPFSIKLVVAKHLEIEKIPQKQKDINSLALELEKFKAKKKDMDKKVSEIQDELARKKENMLSDLEAKFKKEMEKSRKG